MFMISRFGEESTMRARIIFSLSLLIPFALVFLYVWTTATDIVFRDDMYLIKGGFIESYLKGTLTFADLWRPTDSMRILGGALLYIANVKWFSMDLRLIVLLIPFLMLASALLIYRDYRKSLMPESSPEFIATAFLVLTLIIFNVIQWEGLIYGNIIASQYPMPFIIASFISLELFLSKGGWKYLPAAFILAPLTILVFGGKLVFAFAPTLGLTFLCFLLTHRSLLTKDFWFRAIMISVFLAAIAFLYIFRIDYNDYVQYSSHYAADVLGVFSRPLEAAQFLLAAFGASIVGVDVFFTCDYFSVQSMVFIGLIVVLLYALALILFFRSRMYERTYLPFFLIMQTFFYLVFVMIGRFGIGDISYGMASRYTYISIYGLVALVWIFIFTLARPVQSSTMLKGTIYASFVMIFTGLLLTSIVVWSNQPGQKAYFDQLRNIAMRVDTATPEELSKFAERPELVRDSLRLLREYKLNVYHTAPVDRE
jgi:hypothetical protein